MEDFIGPVVVLEKPRERVAGGEADFPFVAFTGLGHEALLDEVEDGVAFQRRELGVEGEGPGEVDHHLVPVDPGGHETGLAHHGVAGFVPELAGHVAVVAPGFAGRLGDDAGHHLGHIDFTDAFVEHHQCLRIGGHGLVVEEDLGVDPHVVGIGETRVAFGNGIVDERLGGKEPGWKRSRRSFGAVQTTGGGEGLVEELQPTAEGFADLVGNEGVQRLRPVVDHFLHFKTREPADPDGRMIGERVGVADVAFQRGLQGWKRLGVEAEEKGFSRRNRFDFVEEEFQPGMGSGFEAERRFPHLPYPPADLGDVFRAEMGVEAEGHLQLIDGFGRQTRDEDLVDAPEGRVVAFEPQDTVFD